MIDTPEGSPLDQGSAERLRLLQRLEYCFESPLVVAVDSSQFGYSELIAGMARPSATEVERGLVHGRSVEVLRTMDDDGVAYNVAFTGRMSVKGQAEPRRLRKNRCEYPVDRLDVLPPTPYTDRTVGKLLGRTVFTAERTAEVATRHHPRPENPLTLEGLFIIDPFMAEIARNWHKWRLYEHGARAPSTVATRGLWRKLRYLVRPML